MTQIVSIIATHQARIRCLLSQFLSRKIERFQNGSVVKLIINSRNISIRLVYSGELDEIKPERKYYVTSMDFNNEEYRKKNESKFQPLQFPVELNEMNNEYIPIEGSTTFVFYLIRHGQGTHNVLKGMAKKLSSVSGEKDTHLTEKGLIQAGNTGNFLGNNADNGLTSIFNSKYLFVSDLQRTKETLATVLANSIAMSGKNVHPNKMIMLPCSHELNYDKDGNCDGSRGQMFAANENKSSCVNVDSCNKEYKTYKVDVKYYNDFYDGTRSKPGNNKKKCRKTSIISEAIDIIRKEQSPEETPEIGGKRKTKRNKRKNNKKSKRRTKKRQRGGNQEEKDNYLFDAIDIYDYDKVENALNNGANVNARNKDGDTPLIRAIKLEDIDMVYLLLERPDINIELDLATNKELQLAEELTPEGEEQNGIPYAIEDYIETINKIKKQKDDNIKELSNYKRANISSLKTTAYYQAPSALDTYINQNPGTIERPYGPLGGKRKSKKARKSRKVRKSRKK